MDTDGEYTFACPNCGERIVVNEPMREALLRSGCIVCDETVESNDFRPSV